MARQRRRRRRRCRVRAAAGRRGDLRAGRLRRLRVSGRGSAATAVPRVGVPDGAPGPLELRDLPALARDERDRQHGLRQPARGRDRPVGRLSRAGRHPGALLRLDAGRTAHRPRVPLVAVPQRLRQALHRGGRIAGPARQPLRHPAVLRPRRRRDLRLPARHLRRPARRTPHRRRPGRARVPQDRTDLALQQGLAAAGQHRGPVRDQPELPRLQRRRGQDHPDGRLPVPHLPVQLPPVHLPAHPARFRSTTSPVAAPSITSTTRQTPPGSWVG